MVTVEKFTISVKHYISNLVIVWAAIIFYQNNNYYAGFLSRHTQMVLLTLALIYTFFGLFYNILRPMEHLSKSKGTAFFSSMKKLARQSLTYVQNFDKDPHHPLPKLDPHEKTRILFFIVKIFFLPIMLNFAFGNFHLFLGYLQRAKAEPAIDIVVFNTLLFPSVFYLMLLIDAIYFSFGYAVEADFLGNRVKSVEPTVLGWAVAIVCYPPFNGLLSKYAVWYANIQNTFPSPYLSLLLKLVVLALVSVYLWATIALGAKCSNLTNRGIVSHGPYRFIRHPAYISKNLLWWCTLLPVMNFAIFANMIVWSVVYYLRAITEEMHLIRDPDYQGYCKKVRYRFIPGVW
jgi:protein-S-isoprenylcysteine O-methyltransferase Ste14